MKQVVVLIEHALGYPHMALEGRTWSILMFHHSGKHECRYEWDTKRVCHSLIVFLKGMNQLMEFYDKKMHVPLTGDYLKQMRDTVREQTDEGMMALMATHDQGILIITGYIPAIRHKNNPFYDPEYASSQGQGLLMDPMAVDYSAVCTMIDQGMLSDLALNSLKGHEYGHKLLQDNIQYIADYMFAQHR